VSIKGVKTTLLRVFQSIKENSLNFSDNGLWSAWLLMLIAVGLSALLNASSLYCYLTLPYLRGGQVVTPAQR